VPQSTTAPPSPKLSSSDDAVKWIVVLAVVLVALLSVLVTRKLVAPVDGFMTQQVCKSYGKEIGRELESYQRSNRLALANRTDGSCTYRPTTDSPDKLIVSIPDAHPTSVYGAAKFITFLLQLGAASAAVRLLADPLFDRFVRKRPRSSDDA
jgi:hypothetical protein